VLNHSKTEEREIMEQVYVVDTTLRDGEQSPEISFTPEEKLRFAQQLTCLGVDVIDAGYPALGKDDAHAVSLVAQEVHGPVIMALARPDDEEIRC
jgi:2-isopropylmalate synthase